MVQPHKKPDQTVCPKAKERAIHDLVLLKAITAKDNPAPDTTTVSNAPPEANVFLCSILAENPELFKIYPEECQTHAPSTETATTPTVGSIQQPTQPINQIPQDDVAFLQTSADALLHKINTLRGEKPRALNPKALPFTPLPSSSSATDHCLVTTIAEVHPQPKEVLPHTCDEESRPTSATQEEEEQPPKKKRVRWNPELSILYNIEAEGEQKPTSATLLQQKEHAAKKRSWCTNRSKRYRDQLVDWVITMHQLDTLNSHSEPL